MSMKFLLFSIVASSTILLGSAVLVSPVLAQSSSDICTCFCAIEGSGATIPTNGSSVTSSECQNLCRGQYSTVATCATTPRQYPEYNVMCFKPDECTSQGGVTTASGTGKATQPAECKPGMFHCYPNPDNAKEVTLSTAVAGLTVTGDLGEYISSWYKWMLGAGTTIAIVFIMVAGLRWSLGGTSAEQIGQAKKTISNAVIGLVLLLSTYVILLTVNPLLLKLQVPAFPMIKTVSLVNSDTSCGYLTGVWGSGTTPYVTKSGAPSDSPYAAGGAVGKGYTVTAPGEGGKCGEVTTVEKDPEGVTTLEGETCTYDYCSVRGEKCFVNAAGGQCVGCKQVISGNDYFTPSTSVCSQLSLPRTYVGSGPFIQECFWTTAAYINTADITANYSTWDDGACAMLTIKCNEIKTCEDYDTKPTVSNDSATIPLEQIIFAGLSGSTNMGDKSLKTICTEDPCGVGAATKTRCQSSWEYVVGDGITAATLQIFEGNDCNSVAP